MADFKKQFNEIFDQAPSFSKQARVNVKRKISKRKTNRRWQGLIVIAIVILFISVISWNENLFSGLGAKKTTSTNYAPEHDLKQGVISDILIERDSQFVINNSEEREPLNSMNRGNGEYIGELVVETNFEEVKYGQVVLVEEEVVDDVHRYELARVIGKPGDIVRIDEGQIYLNNAPIAAFYGKAQDAYFKRVEEANERFNGDEQQGLKEKLKNLITISMDEVTILNGELFIVSDNWTSQSIRKVINETAVEGIVLGYKHEREDQVNGRALTEEEFITIQSLSEQVLAAFEAKDTDALRSLVSEKVTIDEKEKVFVDSFKETIKIEKQPVTNEIGESFLSYYQPIVWSNELKLEKEALMSFKYKDNDGYKYLGFILENGEWKFGGFGN